MQKLKEHSSLSDPHTAAQELLRIVREKITVDRPHGYTGVTNHEFVWKSGGTLAEYVAGRNYAIANGLFRISECGTRIYLPT